MTQVHGLKNGDEVAYEGVLRYCLLVDIMKMVSDSVTCIAEGKNININITFNNNK